MKGEVISMYKDYIIAREYWRLHNKCPICKSDNIETTTAGILLSINDKDGYRIKKDQNRAHCGCGWEGIAHDLIS